MKVSFNWVKKFTEVDVSIDTLVERIGAQLGAVEEVIDLGKRYKGIVIAKVVSCEDHPNADRLHVCLLDDGGVTKDVERNDDGLVQVVCGAPNVRVGLTVAWLPPGSTVPSSFEDEPFVLDARELRGVKSNGMIASPSELAVSDSHEGILEVDIPAEPGMPVANVYELNDYIIDIENKMFTHRPDCFGIIGVAREIAGIFGKPFTSPDWYQIPLGRHKIEGQSLPLDVKNEIPELVPRFSAIALSGAEVAPSSIMVQSYLYRVGIRPISNLVDVTNYVMYVTGQPLHAYDYDKVKALSGEGDTATLIVRKPKTGEKVTLINGKSIEPHEDAILIATADQAIGIGGVMGGANTEVDDSTKNIILEAASFDMYSIRRTSMAHGLFTDAVTRFNKGQSPLQTDRVIDEAAVMMSSMSGAKIASGLVDDNHTTGKLPVVSVDSTFINERLGLALSPVDMEKLLQNVEFGVKRSGDDLRVTVPFWRTDIEIREDLVEEVGRLYGYDNLPLVLPKRTTSPSIRNRLLDVKQAIREELVKSGANEVLTYSFVHGKLFEKVSQDAEEAFRISNALSPDLQYYRLSLAPSLLEKVHPNIKAGFDEFVLFEFGKTHNRSFIVDGDLPGEEQLPGEQNHVAFVYGASEKRAKSLKGAAYYRGRLFAERILVSVGLGSVRYVPATERADIPKHQESACAPFELSRSSHIFLTVDSRDIWIGIIGELKPSVQRSLKLPAYSAAGELDLSALALLGVLDKGRSYRPIPRFPKVEQDICLRVSSDVTYERVEQLVTDAIVQNEPENATFTISPVDIYQRDISDDTKQVTVRLSISSYDRTMTDSEVSRLLDSVAKLALDEISAVRV